MNDMNVDLIIFEMVFSEGTPVENAGVIVVVDCCCL